MPALRLLLVAVLIAFIVEPANATPNASTPPAWLRSDTSTHTLLPDGRTLQLGVTGQPVAQLRAPDGALQAVSLRIPRVASTATVLPNGKVLIWGGLDTQSHIVQEGEWFDPVSDQVTAAADIPLLPRAGHTATVLTDGRLLITGGWNPKLGPLTEAELWDYRTNTDQLLSADLVPARSGHSATLLPDGRVLILGGYDPNGHRFVDGALFDPTQISFVDVDSATAAQLQVPSADTAVAQSMPADQAKNFPYDGLIALRFTAPLAVTSLNTKTVTLLGPSGPVSIRVVPAEAGRLVFVQPVNDLLPATAYTLFVSGAQRPDRTALPLTTVSFSTGTTAQGSSATGTQTTGAPATNNAAPSGSSSSTPAPGALVVSTTNKPIQTLIAGTPDAQQELQANCGNTQRIHGYQFCHRQGSVTGGVFTPGFGNTNARWQVGKPTPKVLALADLPAGAVESGATAVFGAVRRIDDTPLPGVTVSIGDRQTTTDSAGRFVLNNVPAGHQVLLVDGSGANSHGEQYGEFYAAVNLKDKQANALPFNLYVPRITARDEVAIPAPTDRETVIAHLAIPGLEIHLPAGTVLRDRHGKILTHVAVVPMPSDRSPVPLPGNFPVYFSVQPATAIVQNTASNTAKGVELVYPNYMRNVQGLQHLFWVYDANRGGWMTYTTAQLSSNRAQVRPENDLGLNMPMPAGYTVDGPKPSPNPPPPGDCGSGAGGGGGDWAGGDPPGTDFGGPGSGGPAVAAAPVDCYTGTFMYRSADFHIKDVMSLDLTRTYSTAWNAAWNSSFIFGRGVMHNFGMYLYSPTGSAGGNGNPPTIDLVLPNGSVIPFINISGNLENGGPGLWVSHAYPREFYGARLTNDETDYGDVNVCGLCVILTDGTTIRFPDGVSAGATSWVQWIRDRHGNQINFGYSGNQLTKLSSPNGRTITLSYAGSYNNSLVTSATDTDNSGNPGRTVNYAYAQDPLNNNANDLLQTVTYPDGTSETYTYDTAEGAASTDLLQTVTDRRGNVVITINTYDSQSRVVQQTLGDGAVYHWSYGSNYTDVTDPQNHVRHIVFDAQGYPSSVTRANGTSIAQTTTFVRGQDELVTQKTDPLGRQTTYVYDPNGNLSQETLLAGTANAVTYSYSYTSDGFNQVQSATDPLGHTTSYSYTNGCLTDITDALGHSTSIICNSAGQPTVVTDANGNSTIYGYNTTHDLLTVTNALGYTTTYTSDSMGRVTAIQDPLGNKTQIQYDTTGTTHYSVADPPMATIDAMNKTTTYGYDNNVNLTSVTDPNNGETIYGYDKRNRRNSRTDALKQTETWNYDGNGNLLNYTDRNSQETIYAYDELDRPSLVTYPDGNKATPHFDTGNRLTQLVDTVSGTITRGYDDLDRLLQEQTPQGTVNYTYDAAGRRKTMSPGSQAQVTYSFDAANRLTSLTQGTETVQMGYDNGDRRTTLGLPNGVIGAYSYDAANELIGIGYTNPTGVLGNLQYNYDADGGKLSQQGSLAASQFPTLPTTTSVFDSNNRQTQFDGATLGYDADGDLLSDGHNNYTWDARHRLTQISGAVSATFAYDAFNRRISKTVGGVSTTYLYDGNNVVQETTGSTVHTLLTGLGIDERYARDDGGIGNREYFLTDALGSTLALTDSTGTVQQTYAYEPFGEVTATGSSDNPYQYTGRENDGDGLYYYRARYYNPIMKRFISEDPVGLAAGPNEYAYVGGNPIRFVDPTGLQLEAWEPGPGPGQTSPYGPQPKLPPGKPEKFYPRYEGPDPEPPQYPGNPDYTMVCLEVRCNTELLPNGVCTPYSGWKQEFSFGPHPLLTEIEKRPECTCDNVKPLSYQH